MKNFAGRKLGGSNIVELLTTQNLGVSFLKDIYNAKESVALEMLDSKSYYVRTTKGAENKLYVSEANSITNYVNRADILMILDNLDSTKSGLLELLKGNMTAKGCLITSGTMNSKRQEAYEAKMENFFTMEKREDISIEISHGIRVDLENKLNTIYQNLYKPVSTILGMIISWNDEKFLNMFKKEKKLHLLYKWVSKDS